MRACLFAVLLMILIAPSIHPQKVSGVLGNVCTGVVANANEATREITITYPDKKTTGSFVGVLEEGYKQKLKDGTYRELLLSELKPGLRIRVFFKDKNQNVAGKKVKVTYIYRIDFLGRDQYTQLRESLGLPPSIPVELMKSAKLPTTDPLKLYVAISEPYVKRRLVNWVERWNKIDGKKYGPIEIVPELAQADVSAVFFWGTDEGTMFLMPFITTDGVGTEVNLYPATVHLVTRDNEGLKVLWLGLVAESSKKLEGVQGAIEKELEKRMRARGKK